MNQEQDEPSAAGHLYELGYSDPQELALREVALRRQLEAELQQAIGVAGQGDLSQATEILVRLERDDPTWIAPRQMLAEMYFRSGQWDQAGERLTWLELHAVESPRLSQIAAALAVRKRDFAAAIELLEHAAHADADLAGVHSQLGIVLLRIGQLDRAAEVFHRAIEKNETDARALAGLAAVSLRRAQFEEAAELALSAAESEPLFASAHFYLGKALAAMGRPAESLAAFEAFSRLEPMKSAGCRCAAHVAGAQLGDHSRAAEYGVQGRERLERRRRMRCATENE